MFKPHYGRCKCHDQPRLIVVRAGYCEEGNWELKQKKKKTAGKKSGKYHYKREATGEKDIYETVLDSIPDDRPTTCFVCGVRIPVVTHNNMAHVLSKNKFPAFRLVPDNIRILCHRFIAIDGNPGCHARWDQRPRSEIINNPDWQEMFELEAQLKEKYKNRIDK